MAVLVTKWFGTFLCEENRIVKKVLFPKDADVIADKLAVMQRGGTIPEESEVSEGVQKLMVSDRRQSLIGKPTLFDSSFIKAENFGYDSELMHDAMIRLGKLRTSEPISRDRSAVQAVRSLDDLIETCNLMNERLHEWYGLHFPELADYAQDRKYAELIARFGERDAIIEELGIEIGSIGSELEDEDMRSVMDLADQLCMIYDSRERTEEYISEIISSSCPNMCALVGGPLTARLISLAGGLERLASLPSSTVQLLGAEKAMFRHLKSGKKPPKHGIIYQHPEVHRAPYWQRGNIARALACKISIAAKVDQYHGEFIGDQLAQQFAARIEDVKRKYPDPPKKPQKPKNSNRRGNRNRGKGRGKPDSR
jgi:nucleolar protein 56